jgi:hypothetical protein
MIFSSVIPRYLEKIDMDPPNIKVVAKTTTKVDVTKRPALGAYTAFIY